MNDDDDIYVPMEEATTPEQRGDVVPDEQINEDINEDALAELANDDSIEEETGEEGEAGEDEEDGDASGGDNADNPDQAPANASGSSGEAQIPKGRFDEVNAARNRLEDENAALKAALERERAKQVQAQTQATEPAAEETPAEPEQSQGKPDADDTLRKELRELKKRWRGAMIDGDDPLADELENRIEALEDKRDELAKARENAAVQERVAAAIEQDRAEQRQLADAKEMEVVADQILKDYPALNEQANQVVLKQIAFYRDELAANQGITRAEALRQAADKLAPALLGQVPTTGDKTADQQHMDELRERREERRERTARRNADTGNNQPPALKDGVGSRGSGGAVTAKQLAQMSEEEYELVPEEVKAKLRGDSL